MPILSLPLHQLDRCWPLHDGSASRHIEARWQRLLPPHTLMERAGEAVFRLSAALAPHARQVWIACGGGNNGGDGLIAASHWMHRLKALGGTLTVTWSGQEDRLPPDARHALMRARQAGVVFADQPPDSFDLAVDALLGLGLKQAVNGMANDWIARLQAATGPVLCVDLPSGLDGDHGNWCSSVACQASYQRHTLALLTLKPGLFTHMGRTAAGQCWFDDLGTGLTETDVPDPTAWLYGMPADSAAGRTLAHHMHKGSHGDLVVMGGACHPQGSSMAGAALLAARAGLRAGAGRVYVSLLPSPDATPALQIDVHQPELMFRSAADAVHAPWFAAAVCVLGCGGGEAVAQVLPEVLSSSTTLVLDADALNAVACEPRWQAMLRMRSAQSLRTVLTPHPLEAARLLGTHSADVQANRMAAALELVNRFQCTVALKGSGTVVAAPQTIPCINPTGNGLLASPGTGDVLAGLIGALLCGRQLSPLEATTRAVYLHGLSVNHWPHDRLGMTASDVIQAVRRR